MELRSGFILLIQQYKALLYKNLLLAWRNIRSTILQLFSSLFFIFLIFCIRKALDSQASSFSAFKDVKNPNALVSPPIPKCEDKFYVKLPCYDFLWSGNGSARIEEIVKRIRSNNPGRYIPKGKVKAFKTPSDVDDWLASNPMYCPGALHFIERNATVISYGVQTNSTPLAMRGIYEDPTLKLQIPLQLAAEREIARDLIGDPNFPWFVGLKEFAHPAAQISSAIQTVAPTFFLAIAMFAFVFQISALVTEKELKLRQAMTIMGLYDTAYWLSWLTWEGLVTLLSSLFTVLFGMMFQLDFFLHNSFPVVFFLFYLFQLNMTAYAFMLSAFISKSSSSTNIGFFIFIVGFLSQMLISSGFPYSSGISKKLQNFWSLFPPNLFAEGLKLLSEATAAPQEPGISWGGRGQCSPNDPQCVMTMSSVYNWLACTFVLWFVLALYLDNIIPNAAGVRKPLYYFLSPGYWTGRGGNKVVEGSVCSCCGSSAPPLEPIVPDDQDVLEEENKVKKQASEGVVDSDVAVQIRGLVKAYAGGTKVGCCKCKKTAPYHAVKGLWMSFPKDQLFCLLGPNGAGKTTTISCLTGISPASGGDALIYGHSIRSSTEMTNIRRIMGVCPQFDILWDALSALEHLRLFANIKGLPPSLIESVAVKLIAEVKLAAAAKMRSSSFSGGMKRRLSVAIALIGEPKLVILDEPTTGMDPITRRHVWDVIERAKQGRSIVLTTHSMEEADILSDRIGIMAKGRLRCIGTSIRLKSRFGTGFIATVSFSEDSEGSYDNANRDVVKKLFDSYLEVAPKEETKSYITFVIPHSKEKLLTEFFVELQDREQELGIADIQLGLTTLEEVFLNIAQRADLETAAAEETFVTITINSGTDVQIPVGTRFVGIPDTEAPKYPKGVMVEVFWQRDESGALCVSSLSEEMPIPAHVELGFPSSQLHGQDSRGQQKPVYGIVISPALIKDSDLRSVHSIN